MTNFYPTNTIPYDFYQGIPTAMAPTNIDLRAELNQIIWTEKRGIYLLFRKVRFINGYPEKCVCFSKKTLEPDRDTDCHICGGLGYLYDDHIIRAYKSSTQAFSGNFHHKVDGIEIGLLGLFYFEHNIISLNTGNKLDIPTTYDKIIEIHQDIDAKIMSPLKQLVRHDILSVDAYRLEDTGRIEYYRVRTKASPFGSYLV